MQHCLSKQELNQLIEADWEETALAEDEEYLRSLIRGCGSWTFELVCFTYFISQVLEQRKKREQGLESSQLVLRKILEVRETIYLTLEEFSEAFVSYMCNHTRDKRLTLEENLIEIQRSFDKLTYGDRYR